MTGLPEGAAAPSVAGGAAASVGIGRRAVVAERWLHVLVLAICLGLVGAALALGPVSPGGGDGLSVAGHRLPEVCSFKQVTGIPCPGCGLTRSWVSALHGDLRSSLAHHRLGWLVLAYVVAQALRHGAWLGIFRGRAAVEAVGRHLDRGLVLLALLLLVTWVPTLVGTFTG